MRGRVRFALDDQVHRIEATSRSRPRRPRERGLSGDQDFESQNHFMVMAMRRWAGGARCSAPSPRARHDPGAGRPELFQRGETYKGGPPDRPPASARLLHSSSRRRGAGDRRRCAASEFAPVGSQGRSDRLFRTSLRLGEPAGPALAPQPGLDSHRLRRRVGEADGRHRHARRLRFHGRSPTRTAGTSRPARSTRTRAG